MKIRSFLCACLFLPAFLTGETTFSMVKPTAVKEQKAGAILQQLQQNGLKVVALKMTQLTPSQAELFYQEHQGKPFFNDLVSMMTSGPVVAMVLEDDQAVKKTRTLVGSTDPKAAEAGTIRAQFGKSKTENAIHASDSVESAAREIPIFFTADEIYLTK